MQQCMDATSELTFETINRPKHDGIVRWHSEWRQHFEQTYFIISYLGKFSMAYTSIDMLPPMPNWPY
jgi:hypothetical protein